MQKENEHTLKTMSEFGGLFRHQIITQHAWKACFQNVEVVHYMEEKFKD